MAKEMGAIECIELVLVMEPTLKAEAMNPSCNEKNKEFNIFFLNANHPLVFFFSIFL